jgi:hypothetical protein
MNPSMCDDNVSTINFLRQIGVPVEVVESDDKEEFDRLVGESCERLGVCRNETDSRR